MHPGKLNPSHSSLYVSYGGREVPLKEYEILVQVSQALSREVCATPLLNSRPDKCEVELYFEGHQYLTSTIREKIRKDETNSLQDNNVDNLHWVAANYPFLPRPSHPDQATSRLDYEHL